MMTQQRRRAERGDDDTTPGRIVCSRQIRVDPLAFAVGPLPDVVAIQNHERYQPLAACRRA
jgi:hypothetical protein